MSEAANPPTGEPKRQPPSPQSELQAELRRLHHDLRSALSGVLGYVQLAQTATDKDQAANLASQAERGARRIEPIADQLRILADHEALAPRS